MSTKVNKSYTSKLKIIFHNIYIYILSQCDLCSTFPSAWRSCDLFKQTRSILTPLVKLNKLLIEPTIKMRQKFIFYLKIFRHPKHWLKIRSKPIMIQLQFNGLVSHTHFVRD